MSEHIAGYLGRVADEYGRSAGTCFQVANGVLATAWHVLTNLGCDGVGAVAQVGALVGGPVGPATVAAFDAEHDLAVLRAELPLPATATLAASGEVPPHADIHVIGVSELLGVGGDPVTTAIGRWAGTGNRLEQTWLGRVESKSVLPGMSGAPVVHGTSVIGVVSQRYNSADGWERDSAWVATTEDLQRLLQDVEPVPLARRRLDGPVELTLSVQDAQVRLTGPGLDVPAPHAGPSAELTAALWQFTASRARLAAARGAPVAAASPGEAQSVYRAGALLGADFLPGPVRLALAEKLEAAVAAYQPVRLGVRVEGQLRELPWETLTLPGDPQPLALHPLVTLYRQHDGQAAVPPAGPLRILVAISAPLQGGGGVLDYERELRNIIVAAREARHSAAVVEVVQFATTKEIRQALAAGPQPHVLHLSGHGGPGVLEFEDDDGNARQLTADQFVYEAIPPGRMPPVVALAACHSDAQTATGDSSFARGLVEHGVGTVICTETAITDRYATEVFSQVYRVLATGEAAEVSSAVAQARRAFHQQLGTSDNPADRHLAELGEWGVLSVLAGREPDPAIGPADQPADPDAPAWLDRQVAHQAAEVPPSLLLSRDVGQFVGRRREQRQWPAQLLAPGTAGLVLHGIGGVGNPTSF
ncbi:MAG: CHAT domain-containing protein [Frankiaceae bacterium]|jgi:hypothetical protein|nr:CHAT domain-containing protein [Frankiaceae bacterium]